MLDRALRQLEAYFRGERRDFDVALDLDALEPVTRRVLLTLQAIPYGRAVTYGELATLSGTGLPPRAIGSVMGSNPVPILIGCHRVLAGDGLGGYSGGPPGQGPATKRWLLEHEGSCRRRCGDGDSYATGEKFLWLLPVARRGPGCVRGWTAIDS